MMSHLVHLIIPFFGQYGYRILFLSSFLEGLPIIGSIVPGATLAVFGGFLARKHVLDFSLLVLALAAGAYVGDIINYFFGRYFGYAFLKKFGKYIFLTESRLESVRFHVKNNCAKTLIIGRFTAVTRSIAPFAAGASGVDIVPFLGYTFLSAFLWAIAHALLGFIFGRWLEIILRHLGLIFFVAILIGVGCVYAYRFLNSRNHIFKKYHIYPLVLMLFSVFVFTSALDEVLENEWLVTLNHYIAHFAESIRTAWLTPIMIGITNVGSGLYLSILMAALVLYLISKKDRYMAALAVFSLVLGEILQFVLKAIINFPRPISPLIPTTLSSFPSGHATAAIIFGSVLFLAFRDSFKAKWGKYFLFVVILIGVVLIGFSRIYLNVHWISDIIAGYALGLFAVSFSFLFFRVVLFAKRWLD